MAVLPLRGLIVNPSTIHIPNTAGFQIRPLPGSASRSSKPIAVDRAGFWPLSVKEKVRIAIFFEDFFDISRVDMVSLPEAPASLGGEIVAGELLYAANEKSEGDCQVYYLRRAADLLSIIR